MISINSQFINASQLLHIPHGFPSLVIFKQLTALARILAVVVLPVPREP